jgi:hypothetical protein
MIFKIYFNNDRQYLVIDLDSEFYDMYGDKNDGYYAPAFDRKRAGHFGTIYLPLGAVDWELFEHEKAHFIYDLQRNTKLKEEAVATIAGEVSRVFYQKIKSVDG